MLPSSRVATTIRTPTETPTTTPPYFEGLDNEEATDQVAKSSIHTSRFNQINGRPHIDDEDDEVSAGVARHVVKSTSTTRLPSSRYLHHQYQQIYPQTNYNLEDVITRRMDGSGVGPAAVKVTSTTTTTTTTTTTPRPVIKKRKEIENNYRANILHLTFCILYVQLNFKSFDLMSCIFCFYSIFPQLIIGKLIVKQRPQPSTPTSAERQVVASKRKGHKYQEPFARTNSYQAKTGVVKPSQEPGRTYRPNIDYDYYDDEDARVVGNRKDQQVS